MGNIRELDALEEIWSDSLKLCKTRLNRITFEDFKALMKGQPKEPPMHSVLSEPALKLETVIEGESQELTVKENPFHSSPELDNLDNPNEKRIAYSKKRSQSHSVPSTTMWDSSVEFDREASSRSSMFLPSRDDVVRDSRRTSIGANRSLYRRHREIRTSVLEASKQFDKKRTERLAAETPIQGPDHRSASLIMRRGAKPPIELEDAHQRALFEAAARRCGRMRRERNKTKSDVTGMLLSASAPEAVA
jgi:hypothetical protein